ncbi:STAS domain-containing protein [Streptomyces sp. NBC_00249]|uniref:STAS domain-containing protein n=1 Tax=Streptomyces sp. NBC_00249 TaxID=2975690 RepID=UPI00225321FC|nr:STAS domain-containing protein [Streptomyces sp. NBC_00249]MCX5192826.1 STAS domain-containing protein [Streptomyces sp. NBC_00249]
MAPTGAADRFTVDVRHVGDAVVLALAGELDHDTIGPLREALDAALAGDGERLLVDFSDVGFCDSTGLNILLRGRLAARESGSSIELVGLGRPVERMFRITGADTVFTVYPDVERALAERPGHDG